MNWSSFVAGFSVGFGLATWWSLWALRKMRQQREEFFAEQRKRIDDLAEWSERRMDEARREVGLPPRRMS